MKILNTLSAFLLKYKKNVSAIVNGTLKEEAFFSPYRVDME